MIYADYAATTPMSDEAIAAYTEAAKHLFGNSQSLHDAGTSSSSFLQMCRNKMATYINGEEKGVFFTSGGTESNYLALHSILLANKHRGNHIITTAIEHASIHNYLYELEQTGYEVTYLQVDEYGRISLEHLRQSITDRTIIASIQHVNSEIGTIQDIEAIGIILKENNVIFHCDCVQSFGKLPIDVKKYHIDSLSISGHKLYGPKGLGVCYINPKITWKSAFTGTTHENGFRPGTVPIPSIAALMTAVAHSIQSQEEEYIRIQQLRHYFMEQLRGLSYPIQIEEHPAYCLPHIIGVTLSHIEGQYTMLECNRRNIMISTGSACAIGKQSPSVTMIAIGKTKEEAKTFVRLSFGKHTTEHDIDQIVEAFQHVVTIYQGVRNE
ncbi:IscS subfamily cysteine desulfurase [Priestia taiwanensis]|uniref:Cysteine desulfurase n=1 Tax=Priestia taiwanensis TaxID=1347902 RepID=A0A917ERD8_9BACI|nr:IscS subfamily cysteine desulfurase [Priestia taiwanensis]MBM7363626.1 cysteine desulfurase [Priestia taiwanensis]GGE75490.1 cysteine desulfurase [Priestia taiwanensis]